MPPAANHIGDHGADHAHARQRARRDVARAEHARPHVQQQVVERRRAVVLQRLVQVAERQPRDVDRQRLVEPQVGARAEEEHEPAADEHRRRPRSAMARSASAPVRPAPSSRARARPRAPSSAARTLTAATAVSPGSRGIDVARERLEAVATTGSRGTTARTRGSPRRRNSCTFSATCSAVPTKLSRTYSSWVAAAPQRAAARRVEPLLQVGFGIEDAAVGAVRAHDRVEVAADLVAVLLEQPRLAHEPLEAGLPVGLVGVPRLDAQRHLLAAAADPDLGQLLDRLRVAVRAVERRGACPGTSPSPRSRAASCTSTRLLEDLRAACPRAGTGSRTPGTRARTSPRRCRGSAGRPRTRRRTRLPWRAGPRCGTPRT